VYPLPLITELIDKLKRAKLFTKIDLDGAYHQIQIKPENHSKSGFNCQLGHFEFTVMTFGFTNAPAMFQWLMNSIFVPSENSFVIVYLDDILIFSQNEEEHLGHVRWALEKLRENQLFAKMKKCEWMQTEVAYLGHRISQGKVAMDPEKVKAVREWPVPTTVKDVQAFLDLANYYRRFVKQFSHIAQLLTELTKKDNWNWSFNAQAAFEKLKEALCSALVLRIYNPDRETRTEHDASDFVWSGVLLQKCEDGEWHPVAYESRKLSPVQQNYDVRNKEFLAVVESCKKW
jgi:hypothetical protein